MASRSRFCPYHSTPISTYIVPSCPVPLTGKAFLSLTCSAFHIPFIFPSFSVVVLPQTSYNTSSNAVMSSTSAEEAYEAYVLRVKLAHGVLASLAFVICEADTLPR